MYNTHNSIIYFIVMRYVMQHTNTHSAVLHRIYTHCIQYAHPHHNNNMHFNISKIYLLKNDLVYNKRLVYLSNII